MKKIKIIVFLLSISLIGYSQIYISKQGDFLKFNQSFVNTQNVTFFNSGDFIKYYDGSNSFDLGYYYELYTSDSVGFDSYSDALFHINTLCKKKPYNYSISLSELDDHSSVYKFGRNELVGTTEEVIWDGGGQYQFISVADTLEIFSSEATDSMNSTNAWDVVVYGLDSAYNEQYEVVQLKGTTSVYTTKKYLRTYRAFIVHAGTTTSTNGNNLGDITIRKNTGDTIQAKILSGNGQTLMCVYTVPAGKNGMVTGFSINAGQGKDILFKSKFRNCATPNCAFTVKDIRDIYQSSFIGNLVTPLLVPEKTDIIITGTSAVGSVPASASFGLILVDK